MQTCARHPFSVSASSCEGVTTATPTRIVQGRHQRCDLYGKKFKSSDEAFAAMAERGYTEPYYKRSSVPLEAFKRLAHHRQQCKFDALYRLWKWRMKNGLPENPLHRTLIETAREVGIFHPVARVFCSPRHTRYDFKLKKPCGPMERSLL